MSVDESAVPTPVTLHHGLGDLKHEASGTLEFDAIPDERRLASKLPLAPTGRHVATGKPAEGTGRRLTIFGLIGAGIFVMGLAMQAVLTGKWHMAADASYVTQGTISIELSFLLNRWLTWRDRNVRFWPAFGRYNVQKAVTSVLNLAAYAALVGLGMNYLLANIVLVGVFSAINYVAGDVLVFTRLRGAHRPSSATRTTRTGLPDVAEREFAGSGAATTGTVTTDWLPAVSVVIPCKESQRTIRATVEAILAQDYPNLSEVICVGDVGDATWRALDNIYDSRLVIVEHEPQPGKREPNAKRDEGVLKSAGEVVALADSDIVMDRGWLSRAVALLDSQGRKGLVAGGMRSAHDSFWGTFVDTNQLAAKTPRLPRPYRVTATNFGKSGFKPPITANALFVRELYDQTPLDVEWSYGYEDYEWFWRVVRDGHMVLFSEELTGAHHHRRSFRALAREYRLSAEGCARFVRAYSDCPLARKRLMQAIGLPLALLVVLVAIGIGLAHHVWVPTLAVAVVAWALVTCREVVRARTPSALLYPFIAIPLGALYTFELARGLVMSPPGRASVRSWESARQHYLPETYMPETHLREAPVREAPVRKPQIPGGYWREAPPRETDVREDPARDGRGRDPRRRIYWPLIAVLAVQTVFSLSLVWSNTAFADEANYLWQGRLEWAHWLHGAPLPTFNDSGVPLIYPPIGALANAVGGLAGARILSMCFMLLSTVLLYLIGRELFGRRGAVLGVALWAVSEPVLRLAFATYDPLSCLLVIASVWLAVEAGRRKWCGELVALSALSLALGSAATFSFAIYVPAVLAISFFIWNELLGLRLAIWCTSWLASVTVFMFVGILTFTHGWVDFIGSTITRSGNSTSLGYAVSQVVSSGWSWDGLILGVAAAGVVIAFTRERLAHRRFLVLALTVSGMLVVAYQAYIGSSWAMDKHVSAGSGFMALAAGYAVSNFRFSWRPATTWFVSAALLAYPAITGLWYARSTFHSWPTTTAVVDYIRAEQSTGPDLVVGAQQGTFWAVQYYLPHLNVTDSPSVTAIDAGSYRLVVMSLDGTLGSQTIGSALLRLAAGSNPGDLQLAQDIQYSGEYRIADTIPYTSTFDGPGVFVIFKTRSGTT